MAAHSKKLNFAKEQLEDAILLFFEKRYISSIVLLGAAEEILSTYLKREKGIDVLNDEWELWNGLRSHLGNPHISKREVQRNKKLAYNSTKHHDIDEVDLTHIYRFGEAFMLLQRVINYAEILKLKYNHRQKYINWFKAEWGT